MVIGLDHVLEIFLLVSFSFSPYFGLVNTSAAYHCLAVTRKKTNLCYMEQNWQYNIWRVGPNGC